MVLQAGKPPPMVGTLAVSPLQLVVTSHPLCCKPPLRVQLVATSPQPGNQGTIFNYLLFNALILEIYFLGLIINIQILSITLLNLKNKFKNLFG